MKKYFELLLVEFFPIKNWCNLPTQSTMHIKSTQAYCKFVHAFKFSVFISSVSHTRVFSSFSIRYLML